eukprot:CAMPEP_0196810062 /NCGR_PEP_ID=MMETSP1362-20130617/9905_1 /TAXON_ID=163516 /ORGANISM="Leptocylindrus danicus, Strain CCMP1856" /LENGTH=71 /DNA_ID=CAMNT_0042184925 /DNA_START=41 /DNA_END=253 /DNA_ORIENTATION=+
MRKEMVKETLDNIVNVDEELQGKILITADQNGQNIFICFNFYNNETIVTAIQESLPKKTTKEARLAEEARL